MGCTVREMLDRIDSRELSEWMAFHNLEPFGDDWRRTGLTTAAVYNVNITKGKRLGAEDFMPIVKRVIRSTGKAIASALRLAGPKRRDGI